MRTAHSVILTGETRAAVEIIRSELPNHMTAGRVSATPHTTHFETHREVLYSRSGYVAHGKLHGYRLTQLFSGTTTAA
jgi:hypothetical protein